MPPEELHRKQRGKNVALALALLALILLIYAITMMRMGAA